MADLTTSPNLSLAGLILNLIPFTNVLAVGDYLTYLSGSTVGDYSRNVGIAKVTIFVLIFVSMLSAGNSVAACASRTAKEQKDCAVGAASRTGGAFGILGLSSAAMPVLGIVSIVLSGIALNQTLNRK